MTANTAVREQTIEEALKAAFTKTSAARSTNKARLDIAREALVEVEKEGRSLEENERLLYGLKNSWRDSDPGKYAPAFFFLTKDGKRAVINGLFPAEAVCTESEWKQHRQESPWSRLPTDKLSPYYSRINVEDAAHAECPHCNKKAFLVQRYQQTEDGPDGDTWEKQMLIVCFDIDCLKVALDSSESRAFRF